MVFEDIASLAHQYHQCCPRSIRYIYEKGPSSASDMRATNAGATMPSGGTISLGEPRAYPPA